MSILNESIDISNNFLSENATYFLADELVSWNPINSSGILKWKRNVRKIRFAFNQAGSVFEPSQSWSFPPDYEEEPHLLLSVDFTSARTLRLRIRLVEDLETNNEDLGMLVPPYDNDFKGSIFRDVKTEENEDSIVFSTEKLTLKIDRNPFRIYLFDEKGKLLTSSIHTHTQNSLRNSDTPLFSIVENTEDWSRTGCAAFSINPDEAFFGTGESFTRLNKRGQKCVLWCEDTNGCQRNAYYKPVPFFQSSNGWGAFMHTTSPTVFDFGASNDGTLGLYNSDNELDLFLFAGTPKEILEEYTTLTGRSPLPPLWSFGLWMSRITYSSEKEVREVATRLREEKIPCDVIHIDTGWFEKEWNCDYHFSENRFDDPEKMIADLNQSGFRVSLWQLPYFTPNNPLFKDAINSGFVILNRKRGLPSGDAIIDFTNPEAVQWYQKLLQKLLKQGVSAIKADFGEAAPLNGCYKSGLSGMQEHNRYPLLYNKAVFEITENTRAEGIIWGRSAWAGSQRYPVHWGGDAENSDSAMAASLRAGLSLGLSGFSFWSHDIGGFVKKSPEELYRRWLPFGIFSSHSRCHGAPPKEPWTYSSDFNDFFRETVSLRYRLLPYILAQSALSSLKGYPFIRTLFFEFPEDRTGWFIEDQFLCGSSFMAAPLFKADEYEREVYLPQGVWIDFQSGKSYQGEQWIKAEGGKLNMPLFVKSGSLIPMVPAALCTDEINWDELYLEQWGNEIVFEGFAWSPDKGLYPIRQDNITIN